jgi:hypothetical protein
VVAYLICARESSIRRGDHAVLFGCACSGSYLNGEHPLVYWQSEYHRLQGRYCTAEPQSATVRMSSAV